MWQRRANTLSFSTGVFSPTFCYVLSFLSVSTASPTRTTSFIALVWEHNTRNSAKLHLSFPLTDCVSCAVLSPEAHCSQRPQGEFKESLTGSEQKIISEIHPVKLPVDLLSTRISVDGAAWKLQTSPKTKIEHKAKPHPDSITVLRCIFNSVYQQLKPGIKHEEVHYSTSKHLHLWG